MPNDATHLNEIVKGMMALQDEICRGLEGLDGLAQFEEDVWERPEGGGGQSRVITNGRIIEKGGVNFSHIHGPLPERIAAGLKLQAGLHFHATGVSIVLHALNPFVPIIHMNVRYFEVANGQHWFGGGVDVTPIYIDKAQAIGFHQQLKAVCDQHNPAYYDAYKPWADTYFYLKHRQETRGIGGIFFDHLTARDQTQKGQNWAFVQDVAKAFVPAYTQLVLANQSQPYGAAQLEWQSFRRARYVEFNLLWDKGTRFGLDSDGRTESILMSMPPMARWQYKQQPLPGSPEAATLALLKPIDWLGTGEIIKNP